MAMMKVAILAAALLLAGAGAEGEAKLHLEVRARRSAAECDDNCERDWMPVCGSDGHTYGNDCLLDFAHCENANVTKVAEGKCIKKP